MVRLTLTQGSIIFAFPSPDQPRSAPVLKRDSVYKTKLNVTVGETVTLACNFESNPPAKINWYKQDVDAKGKNIRRGNFALRFFLSFFFFLLIPDCWTGVIF